MACVRDDGQFSVWKELKGLKAMIEPHPVMIADCDEDWRVEQGEVFVRKSVPFNAIELRPYRRPVGRIGSYLPVVPPLESDNIGLSGQGPKACQDFRLVGTLERP